MIDGVDGRCYVIFLVCGGGMGTDGQLLFHEKRIRLLQREGVLFITAQLNSLF